jgi:hypothetical protein
MAGAPSQLELFDFKPELQKLNDQLCPPSLLEGKRFAFIRGTPTMLGPQAAFRQRGEAGAYVSDYLPHFATMADEVSFLKGVTTDQFNHAPAQLFVHLKPNTKILKSINQQITWVHCLRKNYPER